MREKLIQLGAEAKDKITGFKGTVTGKVEYLTGCRQYLVQPKLKGSGDFTEARWFDEDRVEPTDKAPIVLKKTNDGPDMPAPIR